jgi:hypothetical protein
VPAATTANRTSAARLTFSPEPHPLPSLRRAVLNENQEQVARRQAIEFADVVEQRPPRRRLWPITRRRELRKRKARPSLSRARRLAPASSRRSGASLSPSCRSATRSTAGTRRAPTGATGRTSRATGRSSGRRLLPDRPGRRRDQRRRATAGNKELKSANITVEEIAEAAAVPSRMSFARPGGRDVRLNEARSSP